MPSVTYEMKTLSMIPGPGRPTTEGITWAAWQARSSLSVHVMLWFAVAAGWFFGSLTGATKAASPDLLVFRGATMGTTYMVKVSDPPDQSDWAGETQQAIDRELRLVNDQMSTYLNSSELSRFNQSVSTEWFPVSDSTALVVSYANQLASQTEGAFDVTVSPLVDRWSFGSGERKRDIPAAEEIQQIQSVIGFRHLNVRLDPPALKKTIPELQVDLSSIAKGHGVDRIVDLLASRGAENVFVEIGGEVRVSGRKQTDSGSVAWKVGIQKPDAGEAELLLAHELNDAAMATSGDYRNYFEVDGQRYSHTIDPSTGRPVEHSLASVTVIASTCMEADAWATALNVIGPDQAMTLAKQYQLNCLLVSRDEEGMQARGSGSLATVAQQLSASDRDVIGPTVTESFAERMMPITFVTAIVFGIVLLAMAVGVLFGRKAISGSCGGLNARTDPDGVTRCSMCSNPSEGCQELRAKIDGTHHT